MTAVIASARTVHTYIVRIGQGQGPATWSRSFGFEKKSKECKKKGHFNAYIPLHSKLVLFRNTF